MGKSPLKVSKRPNNSKRRVSSPYIRVNMEKGKGKRTLLPNTLQ